MTDPFIRKLNNVKAEWFIDPEGRCVHNGSDYGYRCVAACGPLDCSQVFFFASTNPRQTLWHVRNQYGQDWIVHEALWVSRLAADIVLQNVIDMALQIEPDNTDSLFKIDRAEILPLLNLAAKKNGIDGFHHMAFVKVVKLIETDKLHNLLIRNGVDPKIAKKYRIS